MLPNVNWQVARVTYPVPDEEWGFALTSDGKTLHFWGGRAVQIRLVGEELFLVKTTFGEVKIPSTGAWIVFNALIPPASSGSNPQAENWMTKEHYDMMVAASEKAAATLARLASEIAEREQARRERIAEAERRGSSQGSGKKDKSSRKKMRAGA